MGIIIYIYFSKLETSLRSAYRSNIFYFLYNLIFEYPFLQGGMKVYLGERTIFKKKEKLLYVNIRAKL